MKKKRERNNAREKTRKTIEIIDLGKDGKVNLKYLKND